MYTYIHIYTVRMYVAYNTYVTGSAKTLHVSMQILTYFRTLKIT